MIDYTKPIQADSNGRKAFVRRILPNGWAVVAVDDENDCVPSIHDENGRFVASTGSRERLGSALVISQVPVPERTHTLTFTPTEMALLRVLVGRSSGGSRIGDMALYDKLAPEGDQTFLYNSPCLETAPKFMPNIDTDPTFLKLVEAYK